MHRKFSSVLITVLICLLLFLVAGATNRVAGNNLHVATAGSDSNDCLSPATACLTVQAAINKAADGDTIQIGLGTFPGLIQITNRKQLTVRGTPNTHLIGPLGVFNSPLISITSSQIIRLDMLTLTGDIPAGIGGVTIENSHVNFLACTIQDAAGGITVFRSSNVRIAGCTIQGNGSHGLSVDPSSIATLAGPPFNLGVNFVRNNLFAGVTVGGVLNLNGEVTIEGNQVGITGDGGSVYSCCTEGGERRIINNLVGVSMRGGHLSLRGPGLIAGNTQHGVTLLGTTAIFNRFGTAKVVVRDNAVGVLSIASHLELFFVDVINNTGGGVVIRNNSSARVFGSVVSNNGDIGMLVERLSSVELVGSTVMEHNRGKDLSCKLKSLGHGDKSGVDRISCSGFGLDEDH